MVKSIADAPKFFSMAKIEMSDHHLKRRELPKESILQLTNVHASYPRRIKQQVKSGSIVPPISEYDCISRPGCYASKMTVPFTRYSIEPGERDPY